MGVLKIRSVPGQLLRNRNFVLLWAAYAASALGDHLSEMAILKSQDALLPGVDITPLAARMTFIFFVPFLLLGPVAGVLADRLPRRLLMIVSDLVRAVVMLLFAALMAAASGLGSWAAFSPLLILGIFAALFSPARSALLPTLIRPDQIVRANGMFSGVGIIATMVASLVGGWLAMHYEPIVSFRIDAATFAVSAVLVACLGRPAKATWAVRSARRMREDLFEGVRYIATHRRVCELLMVAALIWFCGPLVNSVIPAVVRDIYHGDYQTISYFRAMLGAGFVIGSVIVVSLGPALRPEIAITWGILGTGVSIGILAASTAPFLSTQWASLLGKIAIFSAGVFAVSVMASFNSLLQRITPNRIRGRIFGFNDLLTIGALLVATGSLAIPRWTRLDRWVGPILLGVAVVLIASGAAALVIRLRRGIHSGAMNFAQNLNEFVARWWWRMQRIGPSTLPRHGAALVVSNHTCSADPLFLCAAAKYRAISFLVAAEYTQWPVFSFFLRLVRCIPVTRSGQDTAAFKRAARHISEGNALGIFIEGKIVPPGEPGVPRDGAAMLALRTGAVVIPAHISGTTYNENVIRGLVWRHRARVRFGKPVPLDDLIARKGDRTAVKEATARMYAAILSLAELHPRPQEIDHDPTAGDCPHDE